MSFALKSIRCFGESEGALKFGASDLLFRLSDCLKFVIFSIIESPNVLLSSLPVDSVYLVVSTMFDTHREGFNLKQNLSRCTVSDTRGVSSALC